ncbi:RNA-directed DNA polymerase, eukaryota, reverse transcriptase zinc-binding domain protein [Tanacetum coccineum]
MMMLHCFFLASGLKVNVYKSSLYGVDVRLADVQHMAESFGCLGNNLPFTYLGVKVGANMLRLNSWSDVVKKMSNKLSTWKAKTLSVGGRLTLLKSVLGAIPIYYMSLFKAPEGIGNGSTTSFWHDRWYGDVCLKEKFKRLFNLEIQKDASVASEFQMPNVVSSFRRPPRSGIENFQLLELVQMLSLDLYPRLVIVGLGLFMVLVSFRLNRLEKRLTNMFLWSKVLPIKLNVFLWRMLLDRLPTRTNLYNRGIDIDCVLCPTVRLY